VVCLPGNPVSTAVSFRLFVAPVLGVASSPVTAVLDAPVTGQKHKDCFHRAVRSVVDGRVLVRAVGGAGSHLLAQSVEADCLLRVPAGVRPVPGDVVVVYPL
jgi:molybdopterin molybdotransferase